MRILIYPNSSYCRWSNFLSFFSFVFVWNCVFWCPVHKYSSENEGMNVQSYFADFGETVFDLARFFNEQFLLCHFGRIFLLLARGLIPLPSGCALDLHQVVVEHIHPASRARKIFVLFDLFFIKNIFFIVWLGLPWYLFADASLNTKTSEHIDWWSPVDLKTKGDDKLTWNKLSFIRSIFSKKRCFPFKWKNTV